MCIRDSFLSIGNYVTAKVLLTDEEENQAEQCQCLRHSSTDEEVAHEPVSYTHLDVYKRQA